jgi:hypothetical protein
MYQLEASLIDDIEKASYEVARQAVEFFNEWKSGKVYIPVQALRAMGRRYLVLRDCENLTPLEVYEFGRLYAFFCLLYPPNGELLSVAAIAIDFCNLINNPSPTEIEAEY